MLTLFRNFYTKLYIYRINLQIIEIWHCVLLGLLGSEQTSPTITFMEFVNLLTQDVVLISTSKQTLKDTDGLAALLSGFQEEQPIYLLYSRTSTLKRSPFISITANDAEKLDRLKELILADLSLTPQLRELSRSIGLSLTKMKLLFRHLFGDTIYNYYQKARMTEAARLLMYHTVSETGYYLGYSNISHFGRVFEKHYHLKPKKFKESLKTINKEEMILD